MPKYKGVIALLSLLLFVAGNGGAMTLSEAIHQPSQFVELVSADMPEANSDLGQ